MKDSLKDFVAKNREAFDDKEATGKSWKVIEANLSESTKANLWSSVGLWRAAAILFFGISVYFFTSRQQVLPNKQDLAMQVDFKSLESFYRNQIDEKIALIGNFENSLDEEQFTQDFQKLEAMYQVLNDEMIARPSQKVKDALVLNLLVRIDLLNHQLQGLEQKDKQTDDGVNS